MILQRQYANPKRKKDPLTVTWESGYNNVRIHYKNELLGVINNGEELLEGVKLYHEELGDVLAILYVDPYDLHIFYDGIHSPSNTNHPKVNIPSTGMNFIFPLILNFVIFINVYESLGNVGNPGILELITILSGVSFLIYILSVGLLLANKILGFLIGGFTLVIEAGLFAYSLIYYEWGELIGASGVMLILNLIPLAISIRAILKYRKHQMEISEETVLEDIIDDPFN